MSQSASGEFKPVEKGQEQNLPGYVTIEAYSWGFTDNV
jgi:hypothetical protein